MVDAWYAIRTTPSAQRPHELVAGRSRVEVNLSLGKFAYYMPSQNRVFFHRRTKKRTISRLPLLPGYVFVADVVDWLRLCECVGVIGVLGVGGTPVAIPNHQIENLKKVEQAVNDEWTRRAERQRMKRRAQRKWGKWRAQLTILKTARILASESSEGVLSGQAPAGPLLRKSISARVRRIA